MIGGNPRLAKFLEAYGIAVVVIAMMAFLTWTQPQFFLSPENLSNIVKQNASACLLALGMFVVIVTAGIDLSVGSIMAPDSTAAQKGLPAPGPFMPST